MTDDFVARYGAWAGWTPRDVAACFAGAPFPWWVAGGWAVEAFTGTARHHEDVDVMVLFRDLPALRAWLAAYHLWEAHSGTLRPLRPGEDLLPEREQLWVRRDAASPWLMDLLLTPTDGDDWLCKRDHRVRRPLASIGYVADGVPYLRPEIVLLLKAKLDRAKDRADLAAALPLLDAADRAWLREALGQVHAGHPWLASISGVSRT